MLSTHTGLKFTAVIESGIVADTTTLDLIIPNSFQKYRRSNGLRLFDISAVAVARVPETLSYLLSRGSAFPQQWQSEDRRAGKGRGHDATQHLHFAAAEAHCGVDL